MTILPNRLPASNLATPAVTPAATTPAVATPAAVTTPTTTTTNAPGLDPAVTANLVTPPGASPNATPLGIPGLARFSLNTATLPPQPFGLVAGRYPDAVSLPDFLDKMGSSPQGQAAVKQLVAQFEATTGVKIPDAMITAAMAQPSRLLQVMQVTVPQLSAGMDAVNAAARSGHPIIPDEKPAPFLLPQRFDFAQSAALNVPRPQGELKELAPGLLQGDIVSSLPDAQAKANMINAEVFTRLAGNASAPAASKFTAVYNGKEFTNLDRFLDALVKDGHEVSVTVDQRVANFANLKTKAPDGTVLDVPAPLMVRTGIRDAVVPTSHAEMTIHIKSSSTTKGPGINADVKYYQGISGTGFFPVGLWKDPSWCGHLTSPPMTGKDALQAVKLAGVLSDVISTTAQKDHLWRGGYGVTGVCNDSVAVIQQAVTGKTSLYPLLMRDDVVLPELERRLTDANRGDDSEVKTLIKAVKATPSDVTTNGTQQARALASLPWAAGKEPFDSSVHAREVLLQ